MGGSKPQPPVAPEIGNATKEGVEAYVENLPSIIDIQTKYQPQITKSAVDSARTQYFGAQDMLAEGMGRYGDDILDQATSLERKYGPEVAKNYVNNMRAAAPGYFDIKDKYEGMVRDDLALGNQLSPEQTRMVQQGVRAGQQARGNIRGVAPTAEEAMRTYLAGDNLRNQRLQRAYGYVTTPQPGVSVGTSPTAMSTYMGIPAPQVSGQQFNPESGMNYGQVGANFATNQYNQQYQGYMRAAADYKSPWAAVIGGAMQGAMAGGQAGGPWGAVAGGVAGGVGGYATTR
jgi:hypothetical protein